MRRWFWALAVMWTALLAEPIRPTAAEPPNPAIQTVISRQLEAFKKDDARAAFAIASPMIQGMFGDATTFMTMVERGFQTIWRSQRHQFLNLDVIEGRFVQRVLIDGRDGMTVVARYEMVEIDGQWRINSCTIEKGENA